MSSLHRHLASLLLLVLLACAVSMPALAQAPLMQSLREEVLMVAKPGLFTLQLETTLYRPPGEGPHPLVIINHGKAAGDTRFQSRARFLVAAREFVQRGYAVAIPMRQGFSKSSGSYIGGGCNVASNGVVQAEDVKVVLDHLAQRADIDARRVVVIGQSHGGLTTLALGTLRLPNVVGLVNFAGGLRNENCVAWEQTLARAIGGYAKDTTVPSLWFYGDNDSFFPPRVWQDMHAQYTAAGGHARLVAFGSFGSDSHTLFGARAGPPIWLPEVGKFFVELGLPFEKRHTLVEPQAAPSESDPPR
jgi:dienelactone hydrolase